MEPGFAPLVDSRVGIIGLGLMGGSLALELKGKCASLSGYDVDPNRIDQAIERGVIDRPLDWSGDTIDLLILAAPVNAILDWIARLPALYSGKLHLLDLGSTKTQIVAAMRRLPDRISPIGGHPMCGKETSGLSAASVDLYRGCNFVLTPLECTQPETLSLTRELIDALGARALILDPERHDRLAAAISHVPYLAAVALVDAALHAGDDLAWTMAASGFRDSTRLAASDVTMMLDILTSNREAALVALARLQSSLQDLSALIGEGDQVNLRKVLETMKNRRATLTRRNDLANQIL